MSGTPFPWSDRLVRRALGLPEEGSSDIALGAICTDSRALAEGDVFLALRGDRFDGHDFVEGAILDGCAGVIVDRPIAGTDAFVYVVPDTLVALGNLARFRRTQMAIPVIGITGSSGKTTVKDLTIGALSGSMNTHGTVGNLNNRIGVPLTILTMSQETAVLVLEIGTNQPGEVAELARVAEPTMGVVTTVSETHVELLGDLAGVITEKLDLVRAIPKDGDVLVGDDPPDLPTEARRLRPDVRVSGLSTFADDDLRPLDMALRPDGTYAFTWQGHRVGLKVPGQHGVYNALLALAVAQSLGVAAEESAVGVSRVSTGSMRGEVRQLGGLTLVVDCYNANPQSVRAALRTLKDMRTEGRRVAVLGSMLELGERSRALHEASLKEALQGPVDRFLVTGEFREASRKFADSRIQAFPNVTELATALPSEVADTDTVLLKASRGVRLEAVLPGLEKAFGGGVR